MIDRMRWLTANGEEREVGKAKWGQVHLSYKCLVDKKEKGSLAYHHSFNLHTQIPL